MAKKKPKRTRGPGGGRPDGAPPRKAQPQKHQSQKRQSQKGRGRGAPARTRGRRVSGDRWSWYILYAGVAALVGFVGFLVWGAVSDQASGDGSRASFDLPGRRTASTTATSARART